MIFLFYLFTFFIGSAIGSFLGVLVDRALGEEAFWKGRSHCDHCRHKLHAGDLIPVVSFFLLGRKCRYCHKALSWYYPMIEIATGLSFVVTVFSVIGVNFDLLFNLHYVLLLAYYLALISSLIAIFFTDIKFGIIPFTMVGFAITLTIFWYLLLPALYFSPLALQTLGLSTGILNVIASGLGVFAFFFLLFYVTKGRGMGFGDVVYAVLMGFVLGFPRVILGLYIAFVTGALVAVLLIVMKKKKFKGGTIPFGPFLVLGTIISLLWGNALIAQIMQYFML
jgi:leader peptidase (prepilin peptidase)/N-methyltransferase